jgi:hypothetical protein
MCSNLVVNLGFDGIIFYILNKTLLTTSSIQKSNPNIKLMSYNECNSKYVVLHAS